MNSFNISSGLKHLTAAVMIIISIMILLTVGAFLLKILFYIAPIALIAWGGYKVFGKVKLYFSRKSNENNAVKSTGQVVSSEEIINRAIKEREVIDVEYREM